MSLTKEELKARTKKFAIRIINLSRALPQNNEGWIIGKQIIRSGTSVGSNYRATCRARSDAEFISKLSIVIEEADETAFWLEIIIETELLKKEMVEFLLEEANELIAIFTASIKTKKANSNREGKS